jgi:hypothetical protein
VGLAGLLKTSRTLLASSCKRGTQSGCNGIALQALPAAWQAGHMHYLVSGAVEPCRSPAPTCCCPQWSLAGRGNKHSQNEPSSGLFLDSKLCLLCLVGLNMGPHAAYCLLPIKRNAAVAGSSGLLHPCRIHATPLASTPLHQQQQLHLTAAASKQLSALPDGTSSNNGCASNSSSSSSKKYLEWSRQQPPCSRRP